MFGGYAFWVVFGAVFTAAWMHGYDYYQRAGFGEASSCFTSVIATITGLWIIVNPLLMISINIRKAHGLDKDKEKAEKNEPIVRVY